VSIDPSAIPSAMNWGPGMTHDGVPGGHRPAALYAGTVRTVLGPAAADTEPAW
jgi:hypothetical protein